MIAPIDLSGPKAEKLYTRHVNEQPILLANARLIDPESGLDERGGLLIEQGRIKDFGSHINPRFVKVDEIIDLEGLVLAPGMVDGRVHICEPGAPHRETIAETLELAAVGGVTSIAALPATQPCLDTVPNLQFAVRKAREAKMSKLYALGAATQNLDGETLSEVGSLANAGAVGLSNGNTPISRPDVMMRVMSYAAAFGQTLHHFPFEPHLSKGMMNKGALATQLGLSSSYKLAEVLMVQRDISLCESTGSNLHLGPLTCAESLELVRAAKAKGLTISCSTAPQYFCLNELEIQDYRSYAKLNPPLSAEDDRNAVAKAVADGTIDCIVSDHCPQDVDAKRVPFEQAAFGMVGLETLLSMSLTLYHNEMIDLHSLLATLTYKAADLLGIKAGRLKVGNSADLLVMDLDRPLRLHNTQLRGKSKNSPLQGFPAQGKAVMTFVDGRLLFDRR